MSGETEIFREGEDGTSSSSQSSSSYPRDFGRERKEKERENGDPYRKPMSHVRMMLLSSYWFSRAIYLSSLLIIIFPQIVESTIPFAYKNRALGVLGMFAAFVTMLIAPVCGYLSDRWTTKSRYGRRLPFVIITTVIHLVTLTIMGILSGVLVSHEKTESSNSEIDTETLILFGLLVLVWTLDSSCDAAAISPYSALIPELVALDQVGAASGWMGFATMMGNVVGVLIAGLFFDLIPVVFIFWIICACFIVGTFATVMSNDPKQNEKLWMHLHSLRSPKKNRSGSRKEKDKTSCWILAQKALSSFSEPFRKSKNFVWVFASRFLMMTSFAIMTTFLQYFLLDVVGESEANEEECSVERAECSSTGDCQKFVFQITTHISVDSVTTATSIAASFVLLGSLFSSLTSGILSDHYGRKVMIYISGSLQAIVVLLMIFVWRFDVLLILLLFFGFGYGAFISVDWALASDALPSTGSYGKDMGVWNISLTLPTVFGPPIAGLIIDILNQLSSQIGILCFGYRVVFVLCAILYALSTILIYNVTPSHNVTENVSEQEESAGSLHPLGKSQLEERVLDETRIPNMPARDDVMIEMQQIKDADYEQSGYDDDEEISMMRHHA